jgi:hypothetical protein
MPYRLGLCVLRRTYRQDYETLFYLLILSKHHHYHDYLHFRSQFQTISTYMINTYLYTYIYTCIFTCNFDLISKSNDQIKHLHRYNKYAHLYIDMYTYIYIHIHTYIYIQVYINGYAYIPVI